MLKKRILDAIDKEAMRTGAMGTEVVSVTLELTDEEKAEFLNMRDFDGDNYFWSIDENKLEISYAEDISVPKKL